MMTTILTAANLTATMMFAVMSVNAFQDNDWERFAIYAFVSLVNSLGFVLGAGI